MQVDREVFQIATCACLPNVSSHLQNVYTNLSQLIEESKAPTNVSLATFKPTEIIGFEIEEDSREWKDEWLELRKQGDLFATENSPENIIPKLPYKFFYRFKDETNKVSRLRKRNNGNRCDCSKRLDRPCTK